MTILGESLDLPRKLRRRSTKGGAQRRFTEHAALRPDLVQALSPDHPALVEGRTIFPSRVIAPKDSPRLLVDGINQRKLGSKVTKSAWKGFPIFSLTLEERATCPRSCGQWATCYGGGMQYSRRHRHGPELVAILDAELAEKQRLHPGGFVIRLHVLGDFYSLEYVAAWAWWLDRYPALHVFGYTHWPEESQIGGAVAHLRNERWDRFAVRTSSDRPGPTRSVVIDYVPDGVRADCGSIICPAQTERSSCCAACALCWSPSAKHETIAFVLHGIVRATGPRGPRA